MKVLANETKRILAVLLSVAMIFAYVPNNVVAYADEVSGNDTEEAAVEDATEFSGEGGGDISDPSQDYYEDTDLVVTMQKNTTALPANTNVVTLAGDTVIPFGADDNDIVAASDKVTALDGGDIHSKVGQIDSTLGAVVYIVPDYGCSLSPDLTVKVTAKYTPDAGDDKEIATSDWSVEDVNLSYLDGTYDWTKAKKVTIKKSDYLKKYGEATTHPNFLAIILNDKASALNTVPMEVTVDGQAKASGYKFNATSDNDDAIDLTESIPVVDMNNSDGTADDWSKEYYDVNVAIVDKTGTILVEYKRNGVAKDDPDYDDGEANMEYGKNAFFLAKDGSYTKLYLSAQGVKTAYDYSKAKKGTLKVTFTKKATAPTTEYDITSADETYGTIRTGVKLESGTEIKTTAGTAKAADGKDVLFNVKEVGNRKIYKVEYFIDGMTDKKPALEYDVARGVFVNDTDAKKYTAQDVIVGDPVTADTYYELDNATGKYALTADETFKTGKTYYTEATGESTTEATEGIYGINFESAYTIGGETVVKETNKGDIKLFITTSVDVTYDLEHDTSKHPYVTVASKDIDDHDFAITATTDVTVENDVTTTAKTGGEYSFTITPKDGYKILENGVTAKMIEKPKGTNPSAVDLVKDNYGRYTIPEVLGAVTIIVRATADTTVKNKVEVEGEAASATDITLYEAKEKFTGREIDDNGENIAETGSAFNFVVTPKAGYGVEKVEYIMGSHDKTTATPVSEKSNGEKEYTIPKVDGDITITVTTGTAVNVQKIKNVDAKVTYIASDGTFSDVVKDKKDIRALTSANLSFKVEGLNGAEVLDVFYGAVDDLNKYDKHEHTLKKGTSAEGTRLTSTNGIYTISATALDANKYLYVITSRAEATTAYTSKVKAYVGEQAPIANAKAITMRAGGDRLDPDSDHALALKVDAYAVLAASFFDKNGLKLSGDVEYKVGKKTAKTALIKADSDGVVADGKFLTTPIGGKGTATDTITCTLSGGEFPQLVTYTATLDLTVEPLKTYYDKVEFAQVVTSVGTASASIDNDPGDTIRVATTDGAIDDTATYNLIPYQTVNGVSKKMDPITAGEIDGNPDSHYDEDGKLKPTNPFTNYIAAVTWKSDPGVAGTKLTKAVPFTFTGGAGDASATITAPTKNAIGDVKVDAKLTFVDGSEYDVAQGTTKVVASSYGYLAIPTVTINGGEQFNQTTINLEKAGSVNSASIKWDVYELVTKAGYNTAAAEQMLYMTKASDVTALVDGYDIKKVTTTPSFKLEIDKDFPDVVTVTDGTTNTVNAAKKGYTALYPTATINNVPVTAETIGVRVEQNMSTVEVAVSNGDTLTQFNTGYENPAYLANAPVKKITGVTVSEVVDADEETLGHVLMNVPVGTVITLPNQAAAFDPETVDPKYSLYGWKVTNLVWDPEAGGGTGAYVNDYTYHKFGDKITIGRLTKAITPLWATKYKSDPTLGGSVEVVRYDNQVGKALTKGTHNLEIALSTTANPVKVPIAVRFKKIDTTKGPDDSGDAQYATEYTYDKTSKLELEATGLSTANNEISTTAPLVNPVDVSVAYTDADGVVYADCDDTNNDDLTCKKIHVTHTDPTAISLKIVASETDTIKVKTGQTVDVDMSEFKIGSTSITSWQDVSVATVKASVSNDSIAKTKNPTTADTKVSVTGVAVGQTTLTVAVVDKNGNQGVATAKVVVSAGDIDIVATIDGEEQGNTLYFPVNDATVDLEWDLKKGGAIVDGTADSNWSYDIERLGKKENTTLPTGEVEWGYVPSDNVDGFITISNTKDNPAFDTSGTKLGIGQITVTFNDTVNGKYVKTFPVVTYQKVTFEAPASEAASKKYKVTKGKGSTAEDLDWGIDGEEKIVYSKGKVAYDYDTSDYSASWLDTEDPHEPYWWEATYTATANITNKLADFNEVLTFSKAELEQSIGITLAPAFGSPRVTISNIPDSITLTDETISTKDANGTDVAVISMGVTPYDTYESNPIAVGGDDRDMYMLGIGDRGMATGKTNAVDLTKKANTWDPTTSDLNVDSGNDADPDILDKGVVATASVKTGKNRTDTFTIGKITDPKAPTKQYVGTSKLQVVVDGDVYKEITLNINGEYNTGLKDSDDVEIFRYMENGKDLVSGVRTVDGKKHYYEDSRRVDGGIVNVDGKKILIIGGAQVTTVGVASYDGKNYYVGTDGFVITGQKFQGLVTSGAKKDNDKFYNADADGVLSQSELVQISGGYNYYDDNCQMAVSSKADEYVLSSDGKYYVGPDGDVAISKLFTSTVATVKGQYLANEKGELVTYAMTTAGKITINGVSYIVDQTDNTAKRDDVLYNPVVKWTPSKFDSKWKKTDALPKFTYTVTVTSKNTGKEQTTDGTAVEAKVVKTTSENGVEKITLAVEANLAGYFVDAEGKTPATVENTKNAMLEATYDFKNGSEEGKKEGSGESGSSESEPEQSEVTGAAQNLWYTDVELKLPLESGVTYAVPTEKGTTKWTPYYKVDVTSGDVTVIPTDAKTRKKAASAAGSLIILNIVDDSNNIVGEFRYALPVFFQKPSLKLSAKSGTVVTGKEGIVRTKVTEKKSNGMYEPIDLSDQKDDVALYAPKNASAVTNIESDENEVQITATGKTGGSIKVQLNNWCEPVSLSYSIKQNSKSVLTFDTNKVLMNSNIDDGEEQAVFLNVNGSDWTSDTEVSVTYPRNFDQKNVVIEGVTDGKVTDNEIKIAYASGKAPVKGSYTLTFKASDGGKATLKVVVSNAKLDAKAVTLKTKTNMDLTKKQKLVLEPTLKGIGGAISDPEFRNAQKDVFDVEYVEELNQIHVTPKDGDWTKVSAQKYTESMVLKVGGKECVAALTFKPSASAPSVKIDKVTLPKSKITASGNNAGGEANVLCTYRTGGKTFTLDPKTVVIEVGNGSTYDASTGYVKMKNGATMRLFYNSEGKIVVEDYQQAKGKGSSVKVKLTFDGYSKTITKTFKIAVVNK